MFINNSELDDIEKKKSKKKKKDESVSKNNLETESNENNFDFYNEKDNIKIVDIKKKKAPKVNETNDNYNDFYYDNSETSANNDPYIDNSQNEEVSDNKPSNLNSGTMFIVVVVLLAVALLIFGIKYIKTNYIVTHDIKIHFTTIGIVKNDSYQLDYLLIPNDNEKVTIETINNDSLNLNPTTGFIKALKEGETDIKLFTKSGKNVSLKVFVVNKAVSLTNFIIDESVTIKKNNQAMITITLEPSNATNLNFTYESSNPNTVIVNNGIITGNEKGTAIVTVKNGELVKYIEVTVK